MFLSKLFQVFMVVFFVSCLKSQSIKTKEYSSQIQVDSAFCYLFNYKLSAKYHSTPTNQWGLLSNSRFIDSISEIEISLCDYKVPLHLDQIKYMNEEQLMALSKGCDDFKSRIVETEQIEGVLSECKSGNLYIFLGEWKSENVYFRILSESKIKRMENELLDVVNSVRFKNVTCPKKYD